MENFVYKTWKSLKTLQLQYWHSWAKTKFERFTALSVSFSNFTTIKKSKVSNESSLLLIHNFQPKIILHSIVKIIIDYITIFNRTMLFAKLLSVLENYIKWCRQFVKDKIPWSRPRRVYENQWSFKVQRNKKSEFIFFM